MTELLLSSLRLSVPLVFAAMGGLLCEKSGVASLCIEGALLVSAFFSAAVACVSSDPFLGLLSGVITGVGFMWLHWFFTQKGKADPIISGIALNILAAGLTPLLCKLFFDNTTNTPSLSASARLSSNIYWIVLISIIPLCIHFSIYHTRFGLRLRSAGDGPEALATAGGSPVRTRLWACLLGGALISFGGSYLAISHSSQFVREMSSGKGFIALAAIIFGKWRPLSTFLSCLLFGFCEALQMYLQNIEWQGHSLPVQWVQALPYVLTLLILVWAVGSPNPPSALGKSDR